MLRDRADIVAMVLLVAVTATVYGMTLRPGQDWGGDFSQYINHARNLSLGRPYAETRYEVTLPEAAMYMPVAYPPVFPVLLAPLYRRFGLDFLPMKILVQAFFVLAALTYFALGRLRGLDVVPAATVAAVLAFSGMVLSLKDLVLSDSTFLFLAGLTLCALAVIERRSWDETKPLAAAAVVATLMFLAYATRPVGAALVVAFVLFEALVKRRVRVFNVAVLALLAAGVAVMTATLYDPRVYATQFPVVLSLYLQNALFYLPTPASLWTGAPSWLRHLLFTASAMLVVIAWIRRAVRQPTVVEFYVVAVAAVTLVYSGHTKRYLLPVLAVYCVYAFEGLAWLRTRLRWDARIVQAACVIVIGCSAFNIAGMEKGPYLQGPEQPTFVAVCDFIRGHVDRDALIVSWNPRVIALYTDRRSAWYPDTDRAGFDQYVEQVGVAYVLVYLAGEKDRSSLAPHVADRPERFTPMFSNADFVLYRRHAEVPHR